MSARNKDDSFAKALGSNVRACREAARLSPQDLARAAQLSASGIKLIEDGRRTPRAETAIKLADSLGVPLERLTRGIRWHLVEDEKGRFDRSGWKISESDD